MALLTKVHVPAPREAIHDLTHPGEVKTPVRKLEVIVASLTLAAAAAATVTVTVLVFSHEDAAPAAPPAQVTDLNRLLNPNPDPLHPRPGGEVADQLGVPKG